jgi:glycine C-acetyltransferase/8-amino-7-oxononanoate synthase
MSWGLGTREATFVRDAGKKSCMFDVIVVGARCAGASAAMLLARKGHRVLVVDRATFPSDTLSTHFVWPRGLSYLNRWGLLDRVLEVTPSATRFRFVVEDIELNGEIPLELVQDRFRELHGEQSIACATNRYASVRRKVLDEMLVNAAEGAGAEVRTGFTVKDFIVEDGRVVGIRGETASGAFTERARFVIAADGRRSFFARRIGIPTYDERPKCTFAYFSYFEGMRLAGAHMHKRGRLSLAAVPTNNNLTMVLVFGPQEWFDGFRCDAEANFLSAAQYVSPELGEMVRAAKRNEQFYGTADQTAFWRKSTGPNYVLVGDASCFKDQCTASGMTHAFRDAELAADALDHALKGDANALDTYARLKYLDSIDYFNFVSAQAESNPTRLDEIEMFEGIKSDPVQLGRFLAMFGDSYSVRSFMGRRNWQWLVRAMPPASVDRYCAYEHKLDLAYLSPFERPRDVDVQAIADSRTTLDFMKPPTRNLVARTEPYLRWVDARRETGTWPFTRFLQTSPGPTAAVSDERARRVDGVNFAAQDYLSLSSHPRVHEAAVRALRDFGPHSAGSPMVLGNTTISRELERALSDLLQTEHVLLFSTGWAAGFGSIAGLVRHDDQILMDKHAHACLQAGARFATNLVERHSHLDLESARHYLHRMRERRPRSGILVVTEGLFSMDSDSPDLLRLQEICHEYDATLLVDVAHDLGATGPGGSGAIGAQDVLGKIDLVMGSFSKTFASNGGFLACRSEAALQFVKMFGNSHMFSNALSPMQTAVVLEALNIVRSQEGNVLRTQLLHAIGVLRSTLAERGHAALGEPSPIVPVIIGHETTARRAYRHLLSRNVGVNMLEYPIVASGAARFRLQVMAAHTAEQARTCGDEVAASIASAEQPRPDASEREEAPG